MSRKDERDLKLPSIELVTVLLFIFCTPRITLKIQTCFIRILHLHHFVNFLYWDFVLKTFCELSLLEFCVYILFIILLFFRKETDHMTSFEQQIKMENLYHTHVPSLHHNSHPCWLNLQLMTCQ